MEGEAQRLIAMAEDMVRSPAGATVAVAGAGIALALMLRKPAIAGLVLVVAGTLGAVHYSWTPEVSVQPHADALEPSGWLRGHIDEATAAARRDPIEIPTFADARDYLQVSTLPAHLRDHTALPEFVGPWSQPDGWGSFNLGSRRSGQPGLSFYRHGRQAPGNPLRGFASPTPLDDGASR